MKLREYEQAGVAMTCRSFDEYERMFALDRELLAAGPILDVAGGASSFTAEANTRGFDAYAADPLYAMDKDAIFARGTKEIEVSTAKLAGLVHQYDWTYYGTIDNHRARRIDSIARFITHYGDPAGNAKYTAAQLPELPYGDGTFSLVLCSHFLFLYHDQFDYDFHLAAVKELIRVCRPGGQVRIYPLITLKWVPYPHLNELLLDLDKFGVKTSLETSSLPFIPGSEKVLTIGV